MGASVTIGSSTEIVIVLLIALIAITAIFLLFYGSVVAISGSTGNQGIGLLSGLFLIVAEVCLIFYGHPDYGNNKPIRLLGASIVCFGLLAYAVSFVLYIEKHK